jgi:hypothetical protein
MLLAVHGPAAEKVRVYEMGESDPGAMLGEETNDTFDSLEFLEVPGDVAPLVDLSGFGPEAPTYVVGRDGDGSLALDFDGFSDILTGAPFDQRDYAANRQEFRALSPAWVKPDSASLGFPQVVWSLGS